jgi:hypothetical protein
MDQINKRANAGVNLPVLTNNNETGEPAKTYYFGTQSARWRTCGNAVHVLPGSVSTFLGN